jgi:hypothetical protein
VGLKAQRLYIAASWLLLALFAFLFSRGVMKVSLFWAWTLTALVSFLYFSQLDRANPRTPVPFLRCVDYLSKSFLKALVPPLIMAAVFLLAAYFKWGGASSITAVIVGIIAGAIAYWVSLPGPIPQVVEQMVRGRQKPVNSSESKAAEVKLSDGDEGITWGGIRIPAKSATSHFMVVGTTGSGKTVTLRLLMQEVLQPIGKGGDHRALVYDAKQDIVSQVVGMGLTGEVKTLNPFDERCVAWDIAKDITEPATALQAAATLFPSDEGSSQPFFVDAAQNLLYGVMLAFIRRKSDWYFSDLLRAMQDTEKLHKILSAVPETRYISNLLFSNKDTLNNVMSTVSTKMLPYEAIASMWDYAYHAGHKVSLEEWIQNRGSSNYTLILGNSEKARKPLDALNRVIFKRVSELVLDQPEDRSGERRTWIFLDELGEAGRLDGLSSLLAKGRSKGACIVIGFQDIDGLREVYGEQAANALTGQCNNKAILRIESPATGEWASKLFGSYEAIEVRKSQSWGKSYGQSASSSENMSYSEEYVKREAVLESEFAIIPTTSRENGLTGYYIVPSVGTYKHTYGGDWLFSGNALSEPVSDVADIERRGSEAQFLKPWTDADFKRLRFPELEPVREANEEEQAAWNAAKAKATGGGAAPNPGAKPRGSRAQKPGG